MDDYPKRGDVFWITLDPTVGSETKKTRPCVVISNNAQNKKSPLIIIAPITSNVKTIYPFESKVIVQGKEGKAMLDQIRTVDKQRLSTRATSLEMETMLEMDHALKIALALK